MFSATFATALLALLPNAAGLKWEADQVNWNLNQNQHATRPAEYWGQWDNHTFNPSPKNWRFPFYTLTQDRFVDGDPTNNEANGTHFEHDWMSNQFRFGGDAKGVRSSLDYLQGMGIRGLYFTGSPFLNMPWAGHGYDPLDFTLLDHHWGVIQDWRDMIDDLHSRGMYIIMDNTMSTMGNLLGMKGWTNNTHLTPFNWAEYDYEWKYPDRRYHDFHPSNEVNHSCVYPRMWQQDGTPLSQVFIDLEEENGCRASEFDSYGAILGTGAYPVYMNQLSKFASVQDRLREWQAPVLEKIKVMSCMQISMLDIDGFRMDKGVQITVDAQAEFASYQRNCASSLGKDNFLIVGEIVSDPRQAAVYVGRGKQPDTVFTNLTEAVIADKNTASPSYIREWGQSALDGAAFQYDVYGALTRFLGLDGPFGTRGTDWVEQWNSMLSTNDMVSATTGEFDPRQFFGTTNQDVFRWPALAYGTERQLLGFFIAFLEFPGVPMILFGEEQEYYVLENLADDYVFGRMPMVSQRAWQLHGCYSLGEVPYVDMPFNQSHFGCHDQSLSLDHRDPSHPLRNVLKRTWEMRRQYPVLNDGFNLTRLSERHHSIQLRGSNGVPTTLGIWSDYRGRQEGIQDLSNEGGQGNQGVWMLYHNENTTTDYSFDCSSFNKTETLLAPFAAGTVVKNLYYPYEEFTLESSAYSLGINGQVGQTGCLSNITLPRWAYKALVPKESWMTPDPTITKVLPGHDARLEATGSADKQDSLKLEIRFSQIMDCDSVTNNLIFASRTHDQTMPHIRPGSVQCLKIDVESPRNIGEIPSIFSWSADLDGVSHGVHTYTVQNATSQDGTRFTNAKDRFMFRVGSVDNPMIFPWAANYTSGIVHRDGSGALYVEPTAAGADLYRYSTNFGSSYSPWLPYNGKNMSIEKQSWTGTKDQSWDGGHVILNFWSEMSGSADHIQHTDYDRSVDLPSRRWPHAWIQGVFNQYGYDGGLPGAMKLVRDGLWSYDLTTEFPTRVLVNVWGMNPDGFPDKTMAYGDVDGDNVLDWIPPDSLADNLFNISSVPPVPHIGWRIEIDDGTYNYSLIPVGNQWYQLAMGLLMALIPVITGALGVYVFTLAFYQVKFNQVGVAEKKRILPKIFGIEDTDSLPKHRALRDAVNSMFGGAHNAMNDSSVALQRGSIPASGIATPGSILQAGALDPGRRSVLIATMEYGIEDWKISVKIGGLGVMANLMGKHLAHQDLVWVVPCVGGIDFPVDERAEPMIVTILDQLYEVKVQYHRVKNITYVLLDAPVFRKQTTAEPYPARMDDLDSAIYYSAWNQCIALAIERFNVDLYHINDYHGTIAPLYMLPKKIPCCFSVHNAEFQGLWPLRTPQEKTEICRVYNLPPNVVEKYVQFGEVFNLLHAGASILRIHQKGFGAVGVSNKYGKRSWARYPIFWGLNKVGGLPNPDPSDIGGWDKKLPDQNKIVVNQTYEAERLELRKQAQEWAGLNVDPTAELFVFVGRWSLQKGVDLIADVFYSILEENPKVQLMCIGPVIDLYGKFAALKLDKMMKKYPGRVFSKPEFTKLPPFIFTGAEFALIPSRDEPFGLVAVEFGRKGALGVGARVGGLGQMPGWWYTIESIATGHLIHQFKQAIRGALASKTDVRAMMRARSAVQRFPVAQWVEDLEKLQSGSIKYFDGVQRHTPKTYGAFTPSGMTPMSSRPPSLPGTAPSSRPGTAPVSRSQSRAASPERESAKENDVPSRAYGPARSKTGTLKTLRDGLMMASPLGSRRNSTTSLHGSDKEEPESPSRTRQNNVQVPRQALIEDTILEAADENELVRARTLQQLEAKISDDSEHSKEQKSSRDSFDTLSQEAGRSSTSQRESTQDESDGIGAPLSLQESIAAALPHLSGTNTPRHRMQIERMQSMINRTRTTHRISPHMSPGPSVPGTPSGAQTPAAYDFLDKDSAGQPYPPYQPRRSSSILDLGTIRGEEGEKKEYDLQRVDPFFTDPTGQYFKTFDEKLENCSAKNSEGTYCIEDYLKRSEKDWFGRFHNAKLGKSPAVSVRSVSRPGSFFNAFSRKAESSEGSMDEASSSEGEKQFALDADYAAPKGLKMFLQTKIGDWPIYSIILALGQIIAVNSYQVTLLTGEVGETADKLYIIASIYLASSIGWWVLFRTIKQSWCLILPFVFYGLAFFLLGMGPYVTDAAGRGWLNNVCTGIYAVASSSGSLFFALNFGTEGGAPVTAWVFRACVISGTQQVYIAGLWYWGEELARSSSSGLSTSSLVTSGPLLTAICTPIAVFLWFMGFCLFVGLPNYYRQTPGKIPSFYTSFWRRKIILWLFVTVIIQNYWLSAPYGRNWRYLWSSTYAPGWSIALLMVLFFVVVWSGVMYGFNRLSKQHSWILPIFAIGLGAPRFVQMLWGTSGAGEYVPWGGPVGGALLGRSLWLWLGVLDSVQGVGFGMILLQTLTRFYVVFALIAAQVIGSVFTMVARATAPDATGPGGVFPNFALHPAQAAGEWPFWVCLFFQLAICVGFFMFFRKEQLFKP